MSYHSFDNRLTLRVQSPSRSRQPSRHKSPYRIQSARVRICNSPSALYTSATIKLSEAVCRYDRERDPDFIRSLENRALDKEDFRRILKIGLGCRLTLDELETLMPLYSSGNGKVDGYEFILTFYHLRFKNRDSHRRLKTSKSAKEYFFTDAGHRNSYRQERLISCNQEEVTDVETTSAIKKLREAAAKYDCTKTEMTSLDAFDVESMRPDEFRSHLEKAFDLKLGLYERAKDQQSQRSDQKSIDHCVSSRSFDETTTDTVTDYDLKAISDDELRFSSSDRDSSKLKLREAARLYFMQSAGAGSLQCFDVSHMPPHIFKEQLKEVFKVDLTAAEVGSILSDYEVGKLGMVACADFVKSMLAMGMSEHEKRIREEIRELKIEAEEAKADEEKRKSELASLNVPEYSEDFADDDMESALVLLFDAVRALHRNAHGQIILANFESTLCMAPRNLKIQLQKVFRTKINPKQMGAILAYFNADASGNVVMKDFLSKFFQIGSVETKQRILKNQKKQSTIETLIPIKNIYMEMRKETQPYPLQTHELKYVESDFKSAIAKLTEGALQYDRSRVTADQLAAFHSATMPPYMFKEELQHVFGIALSLEEIAAMMAHFDKDDSGTISCRDFIAQFFKVGTDERSRLRSVKSQTRLIEEEIKTKKIRIVGAKDNHALPIASYEFTEKDFDFFLIKFVLKCHTFDTEELGPLGWSSITSEIVSLAEFQSIIKKSFQLKFTALELGALVNYCYPVGKSMDVMNCRIFIDIFLQNKLSTGEFKGDKRENKLLAEYIAQLKSSYLSKAKTSEEFLDSANAVQLRPWRLVEGPAAAPSSSNKKRKLTNAADKILHRLAVGRKTSRLDLSTRKTSRCSKGSAMVGAIAVSNEGVSPRRGSGKGGREVLLRQSSRDDFEADRIQPSIQLAEGAFMRDNGHLHGLSKIHPSTSCETDTDSGTKVSSLHTNVEIVSPLDCSFTAELQTEIGSPMSVRPDVTLRNSDLTDEMAVSTNTELQSTNVFGRVTSPLESSRLRAQEKKILDARTEVIGNKGVPSTSHLASAAPAFETIPTGALGSDRRTDSLPVIGTPEAGDRDKGKISAFSIEVPDTQDDDGQQSYLDPKKKEFDEMMSELLRRKSSTPKKTVTVGGVEYPVRVGSANDALLIVEYLFSPPYDREVFCCAYVHNAMKTAIGRVSSAVISVNGYTAPRTSGSSSSSSSSSSSVKKPYQPSLSPISSCPSTPGVSFQEGVNPQGLLPHTTVTTDTVDFEQDIVHSETAHGSRKVSDGSVGLSAVQEIPMEDPLTQRNSADGSKSNANIGEESCPSGDDASTVILISETPRATPLFSDTSVTAIARRHTIRLMTPRTALKGLYTEGADDCDILHAVNRAAFTKSGRENHYLVKKISDTGSTPIQSCRSSSPSKLDGKRRENAVKKEAYRQAVEERAIVGMSVELSLAVIPDEVFCMTDLTELWLCHNTMESLPPALFGLKKLSVLSLTGNLLDCIPHEVGQLSNLKRLYLGGNNLTGVPESIGLLTGLVELDISSNSFDLFPHVICTLKSLTRLNLSRNEFTALPSDLKKLKLLTVLDLTETVLREEPSVLSQMGWATVLGRGTTSGDGPTGVI